MTKKHGFFSGLMAHCSGPMSHLLNHFARAGRLSATFIIVSFSALAQQQVPTEVGTVVNGYQDDFNGTSLNSSWQILGANVYTVNNGILHVSTASGDPNHLLYAMPGYNNSVQEVLARIRVTNFGTGDGPRGGIATAVDPAASPAGGIDLPFLDQHLHI